MARPPARRAGQRPIQIAVVGSSRPTAAEAEVAEAVGGRLAAAGVIVVCGGLGGVMEAVCRGASTAGGTTVGLLPGNDRAGGNPHLDVAIPTGLGEGRNALIARSGEALVAIGGGFGTLAEIALALRMAIPVIGLETWHFAPGADVPDPVLRATSAEEAVRAALAHVRAAR